MNNQILNQLHKVTATKIEFNSNDTEIFIPKTIQIRNESLQKSKCYLIELQDFIVNPDESSTLSSNWNNGKVPEYKKYFVEIVSIMTNMIKVNGVSVENSSSRFEGWLPMDGFTVLEKI